MPWKFITKCYAKVHRSGNAAVADQVFLKMNTALPMTVVDTDPNNNYAAGHTPLISTLWLDPDDGTPRSGKFHANLLTL